MNEPVKYATWDSDYNADDKIGSGQASMKSWCPEGNKKTTIHRMLYREGKKTGELEFKTKFVVSPEHKKFARAQLEEI